MRKILLVDDDMDDAALFREALRLAADTVSLDYYYDGKAALQRLAAANDLLPDLIFLDINMPVLNGWQFLEALKKLSHLKDIPVVMYTTSSRTKEMETARTMGASGFFTKPDDFDVLRKMLGAIVDSDAAELTHTLQSALPK